MKARLSPQPGTWLNAEARVIANGTKNTNHNRVKIIISTPHSNKIFLQLQGRHAYELADAIVDAMENQNRKGTTE